MSITSITMSKGTWISSSTSTPQSSSTWLRTSFYGGKTGYPESPQAVVQFTVPNSLKYKKISRVTLNIYINNGTSNEDNINGVKIAPFKIDNVSIDALTYANENSLGSPGEYQEFEPFAYYVSVTYPCWKSFDVTGLYASNLYNDTYFTLKLACIPGGARFYGLVGGVGSGYEAYITIDYEDVVQVPPTPSYPANSYVQENTDILFAWAWNSSTAAVQAAVQLEYKLASAANWTVVSLTQTTHTYKLVGGLPQGAYVWRIKGTNDASETSAYSNTAEFTVIGKPSVPVINTPANRALTEITWQATDQNSFDITLTDSNGVLLIDKTVGSPMASYKPNMFLKGTYTVGIRYRNSSGMTSDWSYKAFSITAAGPTKPTMTLYVDGSKVYVDFVPASGVSYYLIRQPEGGAEELAQDPKIVALGRFEDNTYKFYVPYRYVLRAYAGAGYTDSDPVRILHGINAIVLDTDDEEMILNTSEETYLPYTENATGETAIYNVIGRDYPIVEHGAYDNWQFSSSLFVTEKQKEKLRVMAKKNEIYYRDYSGRGFPVAIESVNFKRWHKDGYIATINFVRVAGEELTINV